MAPIASERESQARAEAAIHDLFERRSGDAIAPLLAPDVRLKPPTYWKTWEGVEHVRRLLGFAANNIDGLRYAKVYWNGRHGAFQFVAKIGDLDITGVDLVVLNDAGQIEEIEIVARPPKAIAKLGERMGASLAADPFFSK